MEDNSIILVPWDFSQVAEYALAHSVQFAEKIKGQISLLHVVKKDKEVVEATNKLNTVAEVSSKKYGIKPNVIVKVGSIFKIISDVANEMEVALVIMGTHGMKGMQKFTGSWALKVIVDTKAPFVVVQAPPAHKEINNVVFPVDFRAESKEKLGWAYYLAKNFNTKIHICKPEITDEFMVKKVRSNLLFAKKYLDERNIDYDITTVEGTDDFAEATIKFAKNVDTDLILILTTKNITLQDYILGADEQKIIANGTKIPVMCVNPTSTGKLGSFAASGG